jgi:hypothetical protein
MSITGLGVDFLGARAWIAKIIPDEDAGSPKMLQANIPTALLPLLRGEKPPTGRLADEHRRGRALAWPPEAQVPPLANHANGSGRVPLCALFELLCAGETEWGSLLEQPVSWRPDGTVELALNPSRLIAQQVDPIIESNQHIGLVVPDALGVGGQQALLSAIRTNSIVLVPRSIAAVLGHCRAHKDNLPRGHFTIIDTSFGAWSVAKIPIDLRDGPKGKEWNVPVSDSRLRRNKLSPKGWGILRKALRTPLPETLATSWAAEELAGKAKLTAGRTETFFRLDEPSYPWQSPLVGESSISRALTTIEEASKAISCASAYNLNHGLIVIGPLAETRFDGTSLTDLIQMRLKQPLIKVPEQAIAAGAAWAAAGAANDWPTWLEQMESLELHYVRPDDLGNLINDWKMILPKELIDAGKEYVNPEPITGLKLKAGSDLVLMTMRRPSGMTGDDWTYREISTAPGKINTEDVSLTVSVRARPGQGFASVMVNSREPGLFNSLLDWQSMRASGPPKPPPKGYIDMAVTLKPAPELWNYAFSDLEHLLKRLEEGAGENPIVHACKNTTKRMNKALTCANYSAGFNKVVPMDDFTLYTPMGREANIPITSRSDGRALLTNIEKAMQDWIDKNPYERQAVNWIKKAAGWWYLGCPSRFVREAIKDINSPSASVEEVHLHIAGLCLHSDQQFNEFIAAFVRKIPMSSAPNNWLKALRNLIKFNEFALKGIDDSLADKILHVSAKQLTLAVENGRPQIALNALESLFFLLKFRRYKRSFVSPGEKHFDELNSLGCKMFFAAIQNAFGGAQTQNGWKLLLRKAVNQKRTTTLKPGDRLAVEAALEALSFDASTSSPATDQDSLKSLFVIGKHIESNSFKKVGRLALAFVQFLNWDGDNEGLGQFLESDDD